jgi:hypothetical protein
MKAVVKSTSNGETLHGQSRAELRSDAQEGVETCGRTRPSGVEGGARSGAGEVPVSLNGGPGARATNARSNQEGIVRTFRQLKNLRFKPETYNSAVILCA